jgi:glycosyltransferase involved in cell wall biosynthesis
MATIPVSVILPAYNAERFLGEALASVRSQTAAPAEIIVVDDASAVPVRESLGSGAGDCRIIRLDRNAGPGVARNVGVGEAQQPYIAFHDADDVWLPSKLEAQYAFMRAWPDLDASHTDVVYFMQDGSELRRPEQPRAMTVETALRRHEMMTPTIMMKKAAFERLGGFDGRFRCTQDWELQIRMALAGFNIQFIPDVLVRVRRERHGNHSDNWRCYLAGHMRILAKHRRSYVTATGYRGWIRSISLELARAGVKQGRRLGKVMALPYRLGV